MNAVKQTQTGREREREGEAEGGGEREREREEGLAPWIIGVICTCAVALFADVAWLAYAFTHSNSRSGLCFILGPVVQKLINANQTLTKAGVLHGADLQNNRCAGRFSTGWKNCY